MKKVALHNLGCKVNAYETEAMQELLENEGYEIVAFKEYADIYIVNTCTVTNMADRKSRQMLHRAKKNNPNAIVVAAGCYVQKEDGAKLDESIDILIGNNKKQDLITILKAHENEQFTENKIDINTSKEYEKLSVTKTADHTRAYIKVQDGCNQFCSYCIIPYVRGRVRSRAQEEVEAEVSALAKSGYKEIVLTGIHLSSYGSDLANGENLVSLIKGIHAIEGIERIRLGSLEPRVVDDQFVETLKELPKVCPHFHLSLQSGCDETLLRMNRKYTTDEYQIACTRLREIYENPAITTDVIVGFPGETIEEFEKTTLFLEKIEFYETHVFKYSKRDGTKAAIMENQIEESIKTERSKILIALNDVQKQKFQDSLIGKMVTVLVEEKKEIGGKAYVQGYTREYVQVLAPDKGYGINEVVQILFSKDSQIID